MNLLQRCELMEKGEYNNNQTNKLRELYGKLKDKYPTCYIAGGCIVDCLYEKDFYDVDVFVFYKDLGITKERDSYNGLVDVIRDEIDGELIDIVVLDKPVTDHIKYFDQNFKKCYFTDGRFVFTEESKCDIKNNTLTSSYPTGDVNYFRLKRTIDKYNINPSIDFTILENYMYYTKQKGKRIRVSNKYKQDVEDFLNNDNENTKEYDVNLKLAKKTKIVIRINRKKVYSKSLRDLVKYQ